MAIVFWSKNYLPLLPYLDELDTLGYRLLFHFVINGLPKVFEPRVSGGKCNIHFAHEAFNQIRAVSECTVIALHELLGKP